MTWKDKDGTEGSSAEWIPSPVFEENEKREARERMEQRLAKKNKKRKSIYRI